jgi:hypothetical protein
VASSPGRPSKCSVRWASLCKAVVERLTYCSHMVETGKDSYRLKRSLARAKVGRKGTTEPKGGDAGQD